MKNQKGAALVISVLCLALLAVVTLNMGGIVRSEFISSSGIASAAQLQASYHAFSGVQYAIDKILTDLEDDGQADNFNNTSYLVDNDDTDTYTDKDFEVSISDKLSFDSGDGTQKVTITSYGYEEGAEIRVLAKINVVRETTRIVQGNKITYTIKIKNWEEEVI